MKKILAITFAALFLSHFSFAEETTGEKIEKQGNDAKREVQKAEHRTEDSVKTKKYKNRAKAKHQVQEAQTRTDDKVKEIKNKVD